MGARARHKLLQKKKKSPEAKGYVVPYLEPAPSKRALEFESPGARPLLCKDGLRVDPV